VRRLILAVTLGLALGACGSGGVDQPGPDPEILAGRDTFGVQCALCHGGNGQGASGPALTDVVTTFGQCQDQLEWIGRGSDRHKAEVGPTYGDQDKQITGVMPGFEGVLTTRQIAQVAAFERSRFGGQEESAALGECGL
jgi:mono/diheme cytochrome c family protein